MSLEAAWLFYWTQREVLVHLLLKKKNTTLMLNPSHNLKDKRCIFPARAQGCDYGIATFTTRKAIEAAHPVRT